MKNWTNYLPHVAVIGLILFAGMIRLSSLKQIDHEDIRSYAAVSTAYASQLRDNAPPTPPIKIDPRSLGSLWPKQNLAIIQAVYKPESAAITAVSQPSAIQLKNNGIVIAESSQPMPSPQCKEGVCEHPSLPKSNNETQPRSHSTPSLALPHAAALPRETEAVVICQQPVQFTCTSRPRSRLFSRWRCR